MLFKKTNPRAFKWARGFRLTTELLESQSQFVHEHVVVANFSS